MSPSTLVVSLVGIAALLLHGFYCLLVKERPLSIGFLNVLLALLFLFVALSLYSGQMVLATEFGTIMVQGAGTFWLLRLALTVTAILPGLCCHRIRQLNEWKTSLPALLIMSLFFGMTAAAGVRALNDEALESLRVYQYDVWWPPLILWFALCFAGSLLALLKTSPVSAWLAAAAALLPPLASFALRFEDLPGPQSALAWMVLERAGFVAATLLVLALFIRNPQRRANVVFAVIAVVICILAYLDAPTGLRLVLDFLPITLLVIAIASLYCFRWLDNREAAAASTAATVSTVPAANTAAIPASPTSSGDSQRARVQSFLRPFPIERFIGIAYAIAPPVIAFGLTDLFSFGLVNRTAETCVLFGFWLLFADRLAERTLDTELQLFRDGVLQTALLKRLGGLVKRPLGQLWNVVASGARFFATGSPWAIAVKAVVMTIGILLLLTGITEAFNYRRLVIQPFRWAGEEKSPDDTSKVLSDGLINALGRMRNDLRTDLILAQRMSSGEHPSEARLLQAGIDSNTVAVAVAESNELQISGFSIPVKPFVAPLQHVVRSFLGIRVVEGTVRKSPEGHTVWANSSDGESWEESTAGMGLELPERDLIGRLIEKLAFDIASSEPSFVAAGMTDDWQAFRTFRQGLLHWKRYEARPDSGELEQAIRCFREAVARDDKFAIAYYRLGLALRHDGQPKAAVAAFRKSTEANPDFVPGALAEASTQYNLHTYYPPAAAVVAPLSPTPPLRQQAALGIWTALLDLPRTRMAHSERQAAYFGICLYELDFPADESTYVPYFYCRQAANLYSRLSEAERRNLESKISQATILDAVGVALESHRRGSGDREPIAVRSTRSIDPETIPLQGVLPRGSRTGRAAIGYYRASLALVPTNPVVRCHAAKAAARLEGHLRPLEGLRSNADFHVALAENLENRGRNAAYGLPSGNPHSADEPNAAALFRRALGEYQAAIETEPALLDALIGYGAVFWQWKLDFLAGRIATSPETTLGLQAEQHAREALRIAQTRGLQEVEWAAGEVLGEVLLGQGRLEEATERLDAILQEIETVKRPWSGISRILWDAAQARLCACAGQKRGRKGIEFTKALQSLKAIHERERRLEWQPFSREPEALDPIVRQSVCPQPPDQSPSVPLPFSLSKVSYDAGPTCEWAGVMGRIDGPAPASFAGNYFLHVWGGGVDRRIRLGGDLKVPIPLEPRATHAYYFARIETDRGEAVSAVKPFATYGQPRKGGCTRNRVTLVFAAKPPSPLPRSASGPATTQTVNASPRRCFPEDPTCAQVRPASLRPASSGRGL